MHITIQVKALYLHIVTTHIFIFKEGKKQQEKHTADTTSKEIFITRRYEHFYYLSFKYDNFLTMSLNAMLINTTCVSAYFHVCLSKKEIIN